MTRRFNGFARTIAPAIVSSLGLFAAFALPAHGQYVDLTQAQMTLLEQQLQEHYKCQLDAILFSREVEVGERKSLEGRVRCLDQREVDFSQGEDHQKFELRLCQPTVC